MATLTRSIYVSRTARSFARRSAAFADHARRATAGSRRRKARTGPGRERSSEIREWARQRGHKVSERGPHSGNIIAEYEASH